MKTRSTATVLLLALLASASLAQAAEGPMNVIFLLADDQRWDTLGSYGNPVIQTPELDQLARTYQVEMPITEQVKRVLYDGESPETAVQTLLKRDLKAESL